METHKQLEEQAAAWLAKRDGGNWSEEDQARFMRWIEESIAHRVAVLRLEAVWEDTRRLKALGAGRLPGAVPAPGEWRHTPFFDPRPQSLGTILADASTQLPDSEYLIDGRLTLAGNASGGDDARSDEPSTNETPNIRESPRVGATGQVPARARRLFAMAASFMLAVGIGSYVIFSPAVDRYSTPIGGIASVPLQDGSKITLNTASRVRVDLSPKERRIDLQQGEAFFEVVKDPNRPFVVRVGDKRVVAVGTKFSVRRDDDDIRVVVIEGTVRLESADITLPMADSNSAAGPGQGTGARLAGGSSESATPVSTSLTAGTIARATDEDILVEKAPISQAEEILSWRRGFLRFHDTPLADAVAEFNRYNAHTITIADPNVAAIRISGTFRPTNYEAFVRLLQEGFSIHAKDDGDTISLTKE